MSAQQKLIVIVSVVTIICFNSYQIMATDVPHSEVFQETNLN